jgi:hypothetical protein
MSARGVGGMLLGYLAIFALAVAPWWAQADSSLAHTTHLYDAQLIVWVLAWVSHALTSPAGIFDANINWPAPLQLTGSEHLLSHQVLFSPLLWTSESPILAANLTTWFWYPLGGTAMAALLLASGVRPVVAWTAGCFFALGPLRVPFSLQTLQYPNALLPLAALAITRLRDRPTVGRAGVLLVVTLLGALTALYAAVLTATGAACWVLFELFRDRPQRGRFIAQAIWAALVAGVVAAVVLHPYALRATAGAAPIAVARPWALLVWGIRWDELGVVMVGVAALLVAGRLGPSRGLLVRGALIVVAAGVILGAQPVMAAIVSRSPAAYFQGWHRFSVFGGFGVGLLAAGAMEVAYARWGVGIGRASLAVFALAFVLPRLVGLGDFPTYEPPATSERSAAYRAVAAIVEDAGRGPLLEVPWRRRGGARGSTPSATSLEPDAMLGSMVHWLPLVGGFTRYYPPHRRVVAELVARLPAPDAIDDLVTITDVDWILLRPVADWIRPREREAIATAPFVSEAHRVDGFTLLRVDRAPPDQYWVDAIRRAATASSESSSLGTPLMALPDGDAVAVVQAAPTVTVVRAGSTVPLTVTIENAGTVAWPAARPAPAHSPRGPASRHLGPFVVHLEATWTRTGTRVPVRSRHLLRRDVRAGESIRQAVRIPAPRVPGAYELVVRITQSDGASFPMPPSVGFRRRYDIRLHRGEPRA